KLSTHRHLGHASHHPGHGRRVGHLLHHFTHIAELLHQLVDLHQVRTGAFGDAGTAFLVDGIRIFAFKGRHRVDDGFNGLESVIVDLDVLKGFTDTGDHAHQILHVPHLFDLLDLVPEVVEIEFIFADFTLQFCGLFFVELLLSAFHERNHVTHSQYPGGHPVGVKHVQRVHFFAGSDKFDGLVDHRFNG